MDSGIRRLLLYQLLLVTAAAVVFLVIDESLAAVSVGFGGGVAAINALLLARCARRDAQAPERSPRQSLAAMYLCVVQRFIVVALLFGFGMGAVTLQPLAVLAGFVLGQAVMVIFGTQQLTQK